MRYIGEIYNEDEMTEQMVKRILFFKRKKYDYEIVGPLGVSPPWRVPGYGGNGTIAP